MGGSHHLISQAGWNRVIYLPIYLDYMYVLKLQLITLAYMSYIRRSALLQTRHVC